MTIMSGTFWPKIIYDTELSVILSGEITPDASNNIIAAGTTLSADTSYKVVVETNNNGGTVPMLPEITPIKTGFTLKQSYRFVYFNV